MLYVPQGCVEAYRTAEGWGEFTHIVEMESTGIESVRDTSVRPFAIYNLNGQRVEDPSRGLYIMNGKKVVVK